jgi:hypothetical protein
LGGFLSLGVTMRQSVKSILRRLQPKKKSEYLRLRVESCVDVILTLDQKLGEGKIKPEIVVQFQRLKEHLHFVDEELVDEKDIDRIETATNQLMAEIGAAFGSDRIGSFHEGRMH